MQLPHDRDGGQTEDQFVKEVQRLEQEQHEQDEAGPVGDRVGHRQAPVSDRCKRASIAGASAAAYGDVVQPGWVNTIEGT